MVEPGVGDRGQRRLGAIGDAQPRLLDHRHVVGAIADRQRHRRRPARARSRASTSASRLTAASTIRPSTAPVSLPSRDLQADWPRTGRSPTASATGAAKAVKPPETSMVSAPLRAHRPDQRRRAGIGPHPLGKAARDDRLRPSPAAGRPARASAAAKSSSPCIARSVIAATSRLEPGIIGQLVDAFLADDGRIHVGDEQPLSRELGRLDDDIDAFPAFQRRARCGCVGDTRGRPHRLRRSSRRKRASSRAAVERRSHQPVIEPSGCYQRRNDQARVLLSPSSPVRPRAASRRWRSRWPSATGGVDRQRRQRADLSRPADPQRRARRAEDQRACRAPALRRARRRRALLGRRLGGAGAGRDRRHPCARQAADPGRRHRPLSAHLARRHRAGPADRSRKSAQRSRGATVDENRAELDDARSRSGGAAQPGRHHPDRARARSGAGRPGGRSANGRRSARAGSAARSTLRPLILLPPRDWLYARCDERFAAMIEQGAVEEVEALLARRLDPELAGHARDRRARDRGLPARRIAVARR